MPDRKIKINAGKISLRGLRTFCVAASHESFTTASEELFITASAVSHQIKSLEQELGEQLFDRNSRALVLTATGELLYKEVSPLIEQLDSIVSRYTGRDQRQSIRISVQPFFASEFFVPRLKEFTAEHPDIDIQLTTSDETSEKHPTNTDLSIRLFRSPPNLPSDLIFPLRLVPGGSPEFAKTVKVSKKMIVSEFPIIVHETRPKAWVRWSHAAGIQLPKNTQVIRLDSMLAAARAAERGIGAALVPVPLGDKWFESGSLVRLFDTVLVTDVSYYLVCNEESRDNEAVGDLRRWVLENFAE